VPDLELLERQRELQALSRSITAAGQGKGQLVVVEGTAGIGKTRLLAAARAEGQRTGMQVLSGRGSELEREFAYGVVRQLFEPVVTGANQTEREELLTGAAGQAAVLFDRIDDVAAPSTGADVSFATLHGLFWLTANLCAHRPLMLIIDDLNWSDAPSLRFLAYLLPRLEGLPLLVLMSLRPAEPAADEHLLAQITTDPLTTMIRPAPLSLAASTKLVRTVLGGEAEEAFCRACHIASGGNPLLLRELANMAAAEGLEPTAAGVARLVELGPRVVGERVTLWVARLGPAAMALCGAVAILGDNASPAHAGILAGLELIEALWAARQLVDREILYHHTLSPDQESRLSGMLGFVHPVVRTAVYEGLPDTVLLNGHVRAAHLLAESGAAAEQVAAHLLLVPPSGDSFVVAVLRRAADEAFTRGSPESVVSYLERCLREPPDDTERGDVLLQLGTAAHRVNMAKAVEYLTAALAFVRDPEQRARTVELLGRALFLVGHDDEAVAVYSRQVQELGEEHANWARRLKAGILQVALANPALYGLASNLINQVRKASPYTDVGGKMLDSIIAFWDMLAAVPAKTIIPRVKELVDISLFAQTQGSETFVRVCLILMAADDEEITAIFDTPLLLTHQRGSMLALTGIKCFRALAWLWRGSLVEAEMNASDAVRAIKTIQLDQVRPYAAAFLGNALMEQGRMNEAALILDWAGASEPAPPAGHWYWLLESRALLLFLQGRTEDSLKMMLACGRRYAAHGGQNPAVVAWRSGAALALLALGRQAEARTLAAEELTLARRWGAPRALGRALRVAGSIEGGEDGFTLLRQAVKILAPSPARLEHAKALIELGAALRRSGQRRESRDHLRRGVELAHICGATPLVTRGWTELRATGARPRHITTSGLDALTPSERRVAELAAAGHSNRDIAQSLFITTNTVEAHLTRSYRKLGATSRADLKNILQHVIHTKLDNPNK
jgi:DNA-binding CsgD family transcriptional regulator